jgi:hypothetical protein
MPDLSLTPNFSPLAIYRSWVRIGHNASGNCFNRFSRLDLDVWIFPEVWSPRPEGLESGLKFGVFPHA